MANRLTSLIHTSVPSQIVISYYDPFLRSYTITMSVVDFTNTPELVTAYDAVFAYGLALADTIEVPAPTADDVNTTLDLVADQKAIKEQQLTDLNDLLP